MSFGLRFLIKCLAYVSIPKWPRLALRLQQEERVARSPLLKNLICMELNLGKSQHVGKGREQDFPFMTFVYICLAMDVTPFSRHFFIDLEASLQQQLFDWLSRFLPANSLSTKRQSRWPRWSQSALGPWEWVEQAEDRAAGSDLLSWKTRCWSIFLPQKVCSSSHARPHRRIKIFGAAVFLQVLTFLG